MPTQQEMHSLVDMRLAVSRIRISLPYIVSKVQVIYTLRGTNLEYSVISTEVKG